MNKEELYALAYDFKLNGKIIDIRPFGEGHINSTYLIETSENKYILQKINNYVFKNVDVLMNNIQIVTSFIKDKGKETLEIIPTIEDKLFTKYNNDYYRVYIFNKDTICYQKVDGNLSLVSSLGEAFGELHYLLSDLDATKLREVIPNFHNTKKRFSNFKEANFKADKTKKIKAEKEIKYIFDHQDTYSVIVKGIITGEIPLHITHNDTKINNVLFDKNTGLYRLVIDLDTVMPGSVLYDIGDAFRGLFTGDNEDNPDLSLQKTNLDVFKAFIKPYINKMKNELTKKEISLIPFSIYLMTIECGMRFLEDYLRDNVYFKVKYEEQNLIRAKTQIALADDVLAHLEELNKIVEEIVYA